MADQFDPYHRWLGIPPKHQPPNHYRLLGLQLFEDDDDVIESAADQRMTHLRTFQTGKHSALSQKLLNEVAAAKVCLLTPAKRTAYDQRLRHELQTAQTDGPAPRTEQPDDAHLADFLERADTATAAAGSRAAAGRKPARLGLLVGVTALAGLLILALVLRAALSTSKTALLLDWPEDQRNNATLKIDGESFAVEPAGPLEHACPPGKHRIRAARPGFEPFEQTLTLEEGQTKTVRLVWKKAAEEVPLPKPGPVETAGKTPPDNRTVPESPGETPSNGNDSVVGPTTPPVEPGADEPDQPPPFTQHKLPVPSADAQQAIVGQLEDVYELSRMKTPEQKLRSARLLFDLGKKSQDDPAERFVLLQTAAELACDAGDASVMLAAIDAIDANFEVDSLSVNQKFLVQYAQRATDSQQIGSLVAAALPLVDRALAQRRPDVAFELIHAVYQACNRSAGKEHRKKVYDRRKEVEQVYQEWKAFQDALATLKTAPDDADANSIVAQWRCFKQRDWEQGLPHLAKGSDEALKTAAQQEVDSSPTQPSEQIKLADAWWDLAQTAEGETKDALMLHAGTWYQKAQPNVTSGVLKAKLTSRLEEIAKHGRLVAGVADDPSSPKPFDPTTVELLATLPVNSGGINAIAFSPDGSILASGGRDRIVRFWDVATRELRGQLPPLKSYVRNLVYSPNGFLAVAGGDRNAILWDPKQGRLLGLLTGHTGYVYSLTISRNGRVLATGSSDRTVGLWDAATGQLRGKIVGHTTSVYEVALSPDGSLLASGSSSQPARLFSTTTARPIPLAGSTSYVSSLAFSPDGSTLAAGGYSSSSIASAAVQLWNLEKAEPPRSFTAPGGAIEALAFSHDGKTLAAGYANGTIRFWTLSDGGQPRELQAHSARIYALAFSPDNSILASASLDGTIKFWGTDPDKEPPKTQPASTTPPAETGTTGSTTAATTKTMTLPGNPDVTLDVKSSVTFIRQAKTGLPVRIIASGNNGHTIHLNGRLLMKCSRDKPTVGIALLKEGDLLAVQLGDRFDIMSLWMLFQTPQREYLFETSEKWTAYLPLDSQRWWDVRNIRPGTKKAQYVKDSRQYVDRVQNAARQAVPNHPKARPITSPLAGQNKRGDSYLYYVVTVEDLLPKTLRKTTPSVPPDDATSPNSPSRDKKGS